MAAPSLACALCGAPCGACDFCAWKDSGGLLPLIKETDFPVPLVECKRLSTVYGGMSRGAVAAARGPRVRPVGSRTGSANAGAAKRRRTAATAGPCSEGMRRLQRFLRLLHHLDSAPWASVVFDVNQRMIQRLTASHLHLIIGAEHCASSERSAMYHLIAPDMKLDGSQNLVWITNRQQGKTSTMGKFIAALAIASPVGGSLCNVYSTSLDRAIELTKAAKQYVTWLTTREGRHDEWRGVRFVRNNYNAFSLTAGDGAAVNEVASKPKNPDSCRGDAPHAAFFDEIGFIEEKFWYKFALPLLQVTSRIATCTTTPPPAGSFFAVFVDKIKQRNAVGDMFFFLENHSLACEECIAMLEADQCCHNLHFVPPWKSLMRFVQMRKLIPAKQLATFQTEVYGVLSHEDDTYFPRRLVESFVARSRHRRRFASAKVPAVWVGIDPAGHQVSEMGMVATMQCPDTAMTIVLGVASVPVAQCQVSEVQAVVAKFLERLRRHPNVHRMSPLVPIVETNNNEVYAMSIVRVFAQYKPVWMPFTSSRFRTHIVDGIGVLT